MSSPLVVSVYPNAFGMGYVISETPKEPINYGVARIRPLTTSKYIKRLLKFIEHYQPSLILLRGCTDSDNRISKRVTNVIEKFEQEAKKLQLPIHQYSREQIKGVFEQFGGNTKYHISKTICSWYPELKSRMPNIRKSFQAEHYQMGLFDAFALMLTHYYLE